ncbi:hypothetical protein C0Q70_15945 [Pomacea canaliculata]|uniref:BRISC and BRCA1-A complex member 1 n=1 Tax=Pomacea canaliculata TaxID=400727 RepID=A0A2T7NNE0_POMCA|nr:BRISC and BRCA1-A complex member 1-like isoform X1 [Pomacea canaliculata]PVD22690.1 hypothetical protein C0Q70_15945 [Pomacea canaliculata]
MEGIDTNVQDHNITCDPENQVLESDSQDEKETDTDLPTVSERYEKKESDNAETLQTSETIIFQSEEENYKKERSPPISLPEVKCPRINCTEKILFCLDLSKEMSETVFRSRVGDKLSALTETKKAMRIYIMNKNKINSRHEYALAVFHDNAMLLKDFTSKPKEIINLFEELEGGQSSGKFDISDLFQLIHDNVELPQVIGDVQIVPPSYIVRVIFIYGRSHCIPLFSDRQLHLQLEQSPYFFVDVLYVHEPPSSENNCEDIFTHLCDLDHKGLSYILEASSLTRLFDSFAKLLAHPLQRPLQRQASYHISSSQLHEEQGT